MDIVGAFLILIFIIIMSHLIEVVLLSSIVIYFILCVIFRKKRELRNIFTGIGLLMTSLLILYLYFLSSGGSGKIRMLIYFGNTIKLNNIERHEKHIAGFGDNKDYWKLSTINPNNYQQFIQKFNLEPIEDDNLFSLMSPPEWWPETTESFMVYEGDDGKRGRIELWIPKQNSDFYLFKFTE